MSDVHRGDAIMTKITWTKSKATSSTQWVDITSDLRCLVAWHLLKFDFCKRTNPKPHSYHQKLKPSQNQYRYEGFVRGDDENRYFYSNNIILLKRLVLNRARRIMEKRISTYTLALQEMK